VCDRSLRVRVASESLQLRMISVALSLPPQNLLRQERFSPQGYEPYPVEVLWVYAPQPQRLSLQMKKLSTAAKLTHTMYGKSRKPAAFDILKKQKIVSAIKIQSAAMSMSPPRGDLRPKNSIDQARLKTSWAPKQPRATLAFLSARPVRHMRKSDIPMSKKSVIHTGENTQLGGVTDGFSSVAYQVGIDGCVKREPMNPTH
jgi:hypothetical protein